MHEILKLAPADGLFLERASTEVLRMVNLMGRGNSHVPTQALCMCYFIFF